MRGLLRIGFLAMATATGVAAFGSAIVVDDDGGAGVQFTDIQAAVNASANGGLILIKAGTYGSFTVDDKSLVITAELGQTVTVTGVVTVRNLSAGRSFAMSGVDVFGNLAGTALIVSNNAGPVLIERGSFIGDGIPAFLAGTGASVTNTQNATFVECSFTPSVSTGSSNGLDVASSSVHLYGCAAIGGTATLASLVGGKGCTLSAGALLFASGSSFVGGGGAPGTVTSPFMLCTDGGPGGDGLTLLSGNPNAKVLDCTFTAGPGGAPGGPACVPGPSGQPQVVLSGSIQTFNAEARTYDISSPVREGSTGFLTLAGAPGEFVWLFFSAVQSPAFSNLWKGTLLPGQPQLIIFVGALPASGTLTVNVSIPVDPSLICVSLIEQALYHRPSTGFVASNPRLGVVLDGSL